MIGFSGAMWICFGFMAVVVSVCAGWAVAEVVKAYLS